ncbi:hypothetical protein LGW31_09340 [Streptococcus mutans]|nr:hypothetical protein [Streptococcus mutans]
MAEHFAKKNLPFIYRIHEEPKAEKVKLTGKKAAKNNNKNMFIF